MTPENAASATGQRPGLTPENAELLAHYAGHLERSLLTGHSPRTYLGAVLACLAWLRDAPADGHPLNDAMAKDRAVRDYRSCLERSTSRYGLRRMPLCRACAAALAGEVCQRPGAGRARAIKDTAA